MSGARSIARIAPVAGLAGSAFLALASVAAAVVYSGTAGEPYSPFDHFVSELGELGVSQLAAVFNLGLFASGLGFVVFMLGVARLHRGRLATLAGIVGTAAGISGALVGVFPMNVRGTHALVALGFFWLGGAAVALASAAFVRLRDPRHPRWLAIPGVLSVVAFAAFLADVYTGEGRRVLGGTGTKVRAEFGLITPLEWAVVVCIVGWVALASIAWLRAEGRLGVRRGGDR